MQKTGADESASDSFPMKFLWGGRGKARRQPLSTRQNKRQQGAEHILFPHPKKKDVHEKKGKRQFFLKLILKAGSLLFGNHFYSQCNKKKRI